MWQLELLSRVIPAFGALAKAYVENDQQDTRLHRDAHDCYADIAAIGMSLSISCGEWASGMNDEDLNKLMEALESRLPKVKRSVMLPFLVSKAPEIVSLPAGARTQYPRLSCLADSIGALGWNGYEECSQITNQPLEKRDRFLSFLGRHVLLFHKDETRNADKRNKFLKRIRIAAKHLLDIYCKHDTSSGAENFNLPQHPSHGMKEFADKVYYALQRHWRCNCSQRATRSHGAREARLSLSRHRQMGLKMSSQANPKHTSDPAKFEVLLPLCKDDADWKATNIEVRHNRSCITSQLNGKLVDNDICRYLLDSDQTLQVDFVVDNEKFWHLKPELIEETYHYSSMEPLRQLLGDRVSRSYISTCKPQDQLLLCYILANSMLYLYPSSWIQTEWSSNMLYFIRTTAGSQCPLLTFPYMAVELVEDQGVEKGTPDHMQSHIHPAILALGIIFLEIMTGKQFPKSNKEELWQRRNEDTLQGRRLLDRIERHDNHRTKRIPSGLLKATRRCLKLEPPANFPSNQLAEEGPIRYYILSCIVGPLVHELQVGYNVRLEDIHTQLTPEDNKIPFDDTDSIEVISRRSTARQNITKESEEAFLFTKDAQKLDADGPKQSFAGRKEACPFRDREETIDERKEKAAEVWFNWHNDASSRIKSLRRHEICDEQRVRIAILDSGIELSERTKDLYNFAPDIQYKNWIDDSTGWKDDVGHGTHLAVLIRKIAPNAIVYVNRVFKKKPTKKSALIVADAIKHVVDQDNIDIIVMSFGFGDIDDTLDSTIQYAASKGVIMFAAASNDGKNRPDGVAWPASDPNVICVHSGDGNGTPSTFTPEPQDSMRIMVLGECIESAWPETLQCPKGKKLMSGTSCAAPIAAGIAALVLDHARGFLSTKEWKRLRRVNSMRKMFNSMSKLTNQNYRWVTHWTWFDSKTSEEWIQGEVRRSL